MFRLRVLLFFVVVVALPFTLAGCLTLGGTPSVWTYYDQCSAQTSSFAAMAECGKQARNAACIPANDCSTMGNAHIQFTDSLALAVRNREMTETEAMRRFAEYKTSAIQARRRDDAIRDAGAAAAPMNSVPRSDAPVLRPMPMPCPPYSRVC